MQSFKTSKQALHYYHSIWCDHRHDIQRPRWASFWAQYLKHKVWSESAKLTNSLQRVHLSVSQMFSYCNGRKVLLLWTETDINCMCLYFIFTGGKACQNIRIHEEEMFAVLFLGSLLYFQNVIKQTKNESLSRDHRVTKGNKPFRSANISEVVCYTCKLRIILQLKKKVIWVSLLLKP